MLCPMGPPVAEPIGLQVTRTAKLLSRAFDDALAEAGGSLPVWLVLVSVKGQTQAMQRELAETVGIEGPTLTHHLNRMERGGLVSRQRDERDRRNQLVELTPAGREQFSALLQTVQAFDRQLRRGFSDDELATLRALLRRLTDNVDTGGHTT